MCDVNIVHKKNLFSFVVGSSGQLNSLFSDGKVKLFAHKARAPTFSGTLN